VAAFLLAAPLGRAEDAGQNTVRAAPSLSGQSRTVYQYQSGNGARDSDLYEYLYLRGVDVVPRWLDVILSGKFLHPSANRTAFTMEGECLPACFWQACRPAGPREPEEVLHEPSLSFRAKSGVASAPPDGVEESHAWPRGGGERSLDCASLRSG
jgi:hypothetical protein